jgi:hypothetical protein
MNNRTVLFVGVAGILAALYVTYFTDWFKPKKIQIMWRVSATGGNGVAHGPNVIFYLNHPYPLTSIKVVEADEAETNKFAHALWHVVANSGPVVTNTFNYGATISGMKPEIASAEPEPLQPDIDYSLVVEAGGNLKGEKVFSVHGP